MRKRFNKITSVLLAIAMVGSLTACTSKVDKTDNSGATTPTVAATESPEATTAPELNLYGYDEPVSLKIGLSYASDFKWIGGDTSTDNVWMDLYKENNIVPEILYEVDDSQKDTKLANAITSGNYPDLLAPGSANFVNYASTGVIADLTDAYNTYASDELKVYLNTDGGSALQSGYVDGKLYGIPKMTNGYDSAYIMLIRQDWLEKLGLAMPTTMEELGKVAYEFSHNDPDGNGANDTYGLALNGVDVFSYVGGIQGFFEGYGAYPGFSNNSFTFIDNNGSVVWGGTLAEPMKAGLTQLKAMYEDGSIPKDFTTMDANQMFEEFGAGRAGIMFAPMWGAMSPSFNAIKADPKAHFTAAQIPDGMGAGSSKAYFNASVDNYFCVSSKCANPEVVIKLMNLSVSKLCYPKSTEEFVKYYGDSTTHSGWKTSLTGTLMPLKNLDNYQKESSALVSGDTSALNPEQKGDYEKMKYYLDMEASGKVDPEDLTFQAGLGLYTVFGDPNGGYAALMQIIDGNEITKSAYNTAMTSTMNEKFPTLNKMAAETIIKIITGDDVSSYDKFLESWNALGGIDVTAEAQAWVDANK